MVWRHATRLSAWGSLEAQDGVRTPDRDVQEVDPGTDERGGQTAMEFGNAIAKILDNIEEVLDKGWGAAMEHCMGSKAERPPVKMHERLREFFPEIRTVDYPPGARKFTLTAD